MVGEVPPNLTMEPFLEATRAQTLYLKSDWENWYFIVVYG
jgi:hypothetical protein